MTTLIDRIPLIDLPQTYTLAPVKCEGVAVVYVEPTSARLRPDNFRCPACEEKPEQMYQDIQFLIDERARERRASE